MNFFASLCLSFAGGIISLSPEHPALYQIEARLDTADHRLYGRERIYFMNPTDNTLMQICFHLYPNAFRDTSSVMAREDESIRNSILGGRVSELTVGDIVIDGESVAPEAITEMGTLLYVSLSSPLAPSDTLGISLKFELTIPQTQTRFGYDELGNYLLSHWHPILCGYQEGKLVDNEYHANSEFFSNFSRYDVRLDLPAHLNVGSTGELSRVQEDSSRAVWQATADSVIDFAFACGPGLQYFESDTLGVRIHYLIRPQNAKYLQSADIMTKLAIAYFSDKLYRYPYSTFTFVDAPITADGLELPGMVVVPFPSRGPGSVRKMFFDLAVVHETAHQWFYASIASNEAEEPWLDEGLASYFTSKLVKDFGDTLGLIEIMRYKLSFSAIERVLALAPKAEYPINLKSWEYPDAFSYNTSVYERGVLVLQTLEKILGQAVFDSALTEYARNFRFRHPDSYDFKNAMISASELDLDRFFEQFIDGTARVDYSVRSLEFETIGLAGEKRYEINMTVSRELEGVLPQRITIGLADGSTIDTTWDGVSRKTAFKFESVSKPVYAALNEGDEYAIDENRSNDTLHLKSFGSRLISFEWDLIFIREFFLSLIL